MVFLLAFLYLTCVAGGTLLAWFWLYEYGRCGGNGSENRNGESKGEDNREESA